jgi:predicted amidohydrolase YtcJ
MTSAVDAGGGGHAFPQDYRGSQAVARQGEMSVRIGYYLVAQTAGKEAEDFRRWTSEYQAGKNEAKDLAHGFELEGGGEFLAHSVGDWENFMAARPDLGACKAAGQDPAGDLHEVATTLVRNHWPLRQHATNGESIKVIMDVFEQVQREQGRFAPRWAIDHAETVRDEELRRIKAMGGGIAIPNRMAFAGEYSWHATTRRPPLRAANPQDAADGHPGRRGHRRHARQ